MDFRVPQESDRISGRGLAAVAVGVTLFSALCVGAAAVLLGLWEPASPREQPLVPALVGGMETELFDPKTEMAADWQAESELLRRYGWVDRERELVRIPIEVAMELWLERRAADGGGEGGQPGDAATDRGRQEGAR